MNAAFRENHQKHHPEFNIITKPIVNLQDIANKLPANAKVLELGTKRSNSSCPTHRKSLFNKSVTYVMTDYQAGLDVDIVCDLHNTAGVFENESFDVIVSCSTFEHFKYPQVVAHNLMKMLKVGGIIFIQTHQTYPLHGYKYDYYRFSREALKSIFPSTMGMNEVSSFFSNPCEIVPHEKRGNNWNTVAESYLNVCFVGKKEKETPQNFIYDFE
jgi:SAM-dependent methyltransferase